MSIKIVVAFAALTLSAGLARAQVDGGSTPPVYFFVDDFAPSGTGGPNTGCSTTYPAHGLRPDDPLKSDGTTSGLAQAIACGKDGSPLAGDDIVIVVLCSNPEGPGDSDPGFCVYQPDTGTTDLDTNYTGSNTRLVTAQYPNTVKIKSPNTISIQGNNWTFSNLVFDGTWGEENGTFIVIGGNNNKLLGNIIGNTEGGCILINDGLDTPTDASGVPDHITISNNIIRGCYDLNQGAPPLPDGGADNNPAHSPDITNPDHKKEPLCIHNFLGTNVTIADNDISDCAGDGYQTEMYEPSSGQTPDTTYHFAQNTTITGNRIWANQYEVLDDGGTTPDGRNVLALAELGPGGVRDADPDAGTPRTMGENAIDIKKSGSGLYISDNLMWGYRATMDLQKNTGGDAGSYPYLYGDWSGTGTGDPAGSAITLHGDFVEDADAGYSCPTDGTGNKMCALVEGNDISDCGGGISVGEDYVYGGGNPTGVTVRGNVIHDLRAMGFDGSDNDGVVLAYNRGVGLTLNAGDTDAGTLYRNRVYRNTVVNIPGALIRTDTTVAATDVVNNLFVNSSAHDSADVSGANCKLEDRNGAVSLQYNAFIDTRSGDQQGTNATVDGGTVDENGNPGLDFVRPSDLPVTPYDPVTNADGQYCGAIEDREHQGSTTLTANASVAHLDSSVQYSTARRLGSTTAA